MPSLEEHWIDVAGGEFWMGGGSRDVENPRHRVIVSDFRLARAQVTRVQYRCFLDVSGHEPPPSWNEPNFSNPAMPVVGVSWDDAITYCAWLNDRCPQAARLPTEAEWEFAAKAGREVKYPWGNDPPESLADYDRRWLEGPEPVDAYPCHHPWGFLGLGENVHEWCSDFFDPDYYAISPRENPQGPAEGRRRSSRGGAWRHKIKVSSCTHRSSIPPHLRYDDYGFRIATDVARLPKR